MSVPKEALLYARWLDAGAKIGLAALVAAFLAYAFGLLDALVPRERLPELWTLSLEAFRSRTGAPAGWGWLAHLGKGDYLSLAGVALLSAATLVCYARIAVALFASGARAHAWLAVAQVAVLLAAASGFIGAGH
jgi:hypothetical protein